MKACSAAKRVLGLSVAERFSPVARVVICWPVAFAAWASHSPGVVPFQNQVGRTACGWGVLMWTRVKAACPVVLGLICHKWASFVSLLFFFNLWSQLPQSINPVVLLIISWLSGIPCDFHVKTAGSKQLSLYDYFKMTVVLLLMIKTITSSSWRVNVPPLFKKLLKIIHYNYDLEYWAWVGDDSGIGKEEGARVSGPALRYYACDLGVSAE